MSKTVAVTGATGHVGYNLIQKLLERGDNIRALVHNNTENLQGLDIETVKGDVRDPDAMRELFTDVDAVFHLAAVISITGGQNGLVRSVNVDGVKNVAETALACGVPRMVHCSSIHAYDQAPLDQELDESRARVSGNGHPKYDLSKAAGELELLKVVDQGLNAVIVNPSGVIGPVDHAPSRMGATMVKMYKRQIPACIAGGFTWVDVRDVVQGILGAEERGRTGENYILSGEWCSMRQIAELMEDVTGSRVGKLVFPIWTAYLGLPFSALMAKFTGDEPLFTREALVALKANRSVSHQKAARELGFQPRPIRETVEGTMHWFAESGRIKMPPAFTTNGMVGGV